ncbi:MAG TPA: hypothetical protein VFG04_18495 [Planctomycetaceae bacterium]|jgi:hypothetical protein|nr:hypothetical protein [Planctomycetaceae bacterium]
MKYYFLALGTLILVCVGCSLDGHQILDNGCEKGVYNAPPAERLQRPGPMVDGPGPGVMPLLAAPVGGPGSVLKLTQVRFAGPAGMQIGWQIPGGFAENQKMAPARKNFPQGATYRLKLAHIPGRDGLTLYPTLQVYPAAPMTDAYLSHDTVPIEITDEDLDQVESNNFVTKVIYLPDPRYQALAVAGVETLVSTRLEPGVDPVAEANRRGTILAVFRIGNMDLEMPNAHAAADPAGVNQVVYLDGGKQEFAEPVPISPMEAGLSAVPAPMIVAGYGRPGMPAPGPIAGVGGTPVWGMPITGTPIGLPGPPALPFGGPAGLQSFTMRNLTENHLPQPVDHMLIDVKETPGYSVPPPVKHIEYTEEHPVYREGEVLYPKWALPEGGAGGTACPPGAPGGMPQQ